MIHRADEAKPRDLVQLAAGERTQEFPFRASVHRLLQPPPSTGFADEDSRDRRDIPAGIERL